jgi:transposase
MNAEGMGPSLTVEGPITSAVFEAYVEQVLAPTLRSGQVVMDNLSAHKGERIKEMIEQRGCQLVYLPQPTLRISIPSRNLYENVKPRIWCER